MKPVSTLYRLTEEQDRPQIDQLWVEARIDKFRVWWPEIVAERAGKIIGYIAVRYNKDGLLVEPTIAPNHIVLMRLIESMENVLRVAGVMFYYFRIEPQRVRYLALLQKHGERLATSLGAHEGLNWYKRAIPPGRVIA